MITDRHGVRVNHRSRAHERPTDRLFRQTDRRPDIVDYTVCPGSSDPPEKNI